MGTTQKLATYQQICREHKMPLREAKKILNTVWPELGAASNRRAEKPKIMFKTRAGNRRRRYPCLDSIEFRTNTIVVPYLPNQWNILTDAEKMDLIIHEAAYRFCRGNTHYWFELVEEVRKLHTL